MLRFLPVVGLVLVIAGVLIYWRVNSNKNLQSDQRLVQQFAQEGSQSGSSQDVSADLSGRVNTLEMAAGVIIQRVNQLDNNLAAVSSQSQYIPDLETRVKKLEVEVADLESRIGTVNTTGAQPAVVTANNQKFPLYIPIATSGTSGDRNIVPVTGSAVSIDPGSYPGYKSVQLEVNMNLAESVGVSNAFLYDYTDKTTVSGSEVSTGSYQSVYLESSPFSLPPGSKIYGLALQSTEGYTIYVQSAQLKVIF